MYGGQLNRLVYSQGAEIDITDGYIHFSTAAQIASTLALHFTGKDNLLLIEVDTDRLDIRYEPARDGRFFPIFMIVWIWCMCAISGR